MPSVNGDFYHARRLEKPDFEENLKLAINCVHDGMPPYDACQLAFGTINPHTFSRWKTEAISDIEAGYDEEDSNLIKLMVSLAKADQDLHRKLAKQGIKIAIDGNVNMLQFLLKTKYNYSEKTKSEVQVTADEAPIKFEIVDMKPNEEED